MAHFMMLIKPYLHRFIALTYGSMEMRECICQLTSSEQFLPHLHVIVHASISTTCDPCNVHNTE